jgi:hypothetical protein
MAVAEEDLFSPFPNWREWGTGSLGLVGTALGEEARLTTVGRASPHRARGRTLRLGLAVVEGGRQPGSGSGQGQETGGREGGVVVWWCHERARPWGKVEAAALAACFACWRHSRGFCQRKLVPFSFVMLPALAFAICILLSSFQNKKRKKKERFASLQCSRQQYFRSAVRALGRKIDVK